MAAGTRDTSKRAVTLRIAPATLAQVDDLIDWLGAPSKNWIWEHSIERWHAQEQARRQAAGDGGQEVAE
jgi:hypothetical protein